MKDEKKKTAKPASKPASQPASKLVTKAKTPKQKPEAPAQSDLIPEDKSNYPSEKEVREMIAASGYPKALEYTQAKLAEIAPKVGKVIAVGDVPPEHLDVYNRLVESRGNYIAVAKKDYQAPEVKKTDKPKAKAALNAELRKSKGNNLDKFGSRVGTVTGKINEMITDDWQTQESIVKQAGVEFKDGRARLYKGEEEGYFEVRKSVEYRIKPGWKPAKAA